MLSYDIGIGIGSLLMGFMQESVGLTTGFALTAIAYVAGGHYLYHVFGRILFQIESKLPGLQDFTLKSNNWIKELTDLILSVSSFLIYPGKNR